MRQPLAVLAVSAILVAPTVAPAQSIIDGAAVLLGYGWLTVAAVGRVTQGNGEADVRLGARIRGRVGDTRFEGTVVTLTADSMLVETPTGTRWLASGDAHDLGVLVGTRSQWAEGYCWGLTLGGGGGALWGAATSLRGARGAPKNQAAVLGVAGGVMGSLAGAAVGALTSRELWASARKPFDSGALVVSPVLGPRPGLAMRLSF